MRALYVKNPLLWLKAHKVMLLTALLLAVMVVPSLSVSAQTPVPTLHIPVSAIFTATNTWTASFAEVMAIGTGIAIAIALLTFIGAAIIKGFRGAGSR